MEELVTISANLGTTEEPLIVHMGITTQACSLMSEMLEKEPEPVSNERWNKILFEASKKYPPEKIKDDGFFMIITSSNFLHNILSTLQR